MKLHRPDLPGGVFFLPQDIVPITGKNIYLYGHGVDFTGENAYNILVKL